MKLRTTFVFSLILAALMHAWVGHDLLHGHHHEELTDSNYTVIVRSQDSVGHTVVALLPSIEPGSLHLTHPPCVFETVEEQLPPRPLLHHAGPLAPRPPPSLV